MRWDDQEFTEVRPGIFGATIDTEQLTVTVYRYEPGCAWETHAHPEDQVTFVVEGGTVDFVVDGRPAPLGPGELAVIPGGVPHSRDRRRRTASASSRSTCGGCGSAGDRHRQPGGEAACGRAARPIRGTAAAPRPRRALGLDQTLALEHAQRLAQRRAADAELVGKR